MTGDAIGDGVDGLPVRFCVKSPNEALCNAEPGELPAPASSCTIDAPRCWVPRRAGEAAGLLDSFLFLSLEEAGLRSLSLRSTLPVVDLDRVGGRLLDDGMEPGGCSRTGLKLDM